MNCNIETLGKEIKQLASAADGLQASYQCDWNDEVHESYGPYISSCKENAMAIVSAFSKGNNVCAKLNALKIDESIQQAESIISAEKSFTV